MTSSGGMMAMALIEGLQKEEDFLANSEVEDTEHQTRSREEVVEKYGNQTSEEDFEHEDAAAFSRQYPVMVSQAMQNSSVELASEAAHGDCHIAVEVHMDLVPVTVRWRAWTMLLLRRVVMGRIVEWLTCGTRSVVRNVRCCSIISAT